MKNILARIYLYPLAIILLLAMASCGWFGGSTHFDVITTTVVNGMFQRDPNIQVAGNATLPCQTGGVITFGIPQFVQTDANGLYRVNNAAVGCQWNVQRARSAACPFGVFSVAFIVASGQIVQLPCGRTRTFIADPSDIDLSAGPPPATFTITGDGMDATYATPIIRFYDQNQTVWLEVNAVGTSPDGTWLQVPSSQINFPDGSYAAVIYSMQADGTWAAVGGADISVFNPPPPPPPSPDPCSRGDCPLPIE
jgi:hypothetical protein